MTESPQEHDRRVTAERILAEAYTMLSDEEGRDQKTVENLRALVMLEFGIKPEQITREEN